jgi:uncharacterized cupin superfamily protein
MADPKVLWKAEEIAGRARGFAQRLNPNSFFKGAYLSRLAGMKRAHVTLTRLPPGRDSFAYHSHLLEEEWVYILSGAGVALIDGAEHAVGPGDFLGFPAPSVPHVLHNRSDEDLVYLMGGESLPLDVIDYPELGKRYLLMPGEGGTRFFELTEATRPFGRSEGPKE